MLWEDFFRFFAALTGCRLLPDHLEARASGWGGCDQGTAVLLTRQLLSSSHCSSVTAAAPQVLGAVAKLRAASPSVELTFHEMDLDPSLLLEQGAWRSPTYGVEAFRAGGRVVAAARVLLAGLGAPSGAPAESAGGAAERPCWWSRAVSPSEGASEERLCAR